MELPFTPEDQAHVMIYALWDAAKGTPTQRKQQVADAIRMTARANPKIKGERLFLLTLNWLRTARVVA